MNVNGAPPAAARVAVIDDKEANLRLMKAYLQGEPYELQLYARPEHALEAIARDPPDLVLLDLMMPGIDGFTMLELLRDEAPGVPVIIVTALDAREARLRGLAAGARDFLTKPVDRTELQIRVRNLVALKQSADALSRALGELQLANRDLQAFAGSLAHDLQQPIASVLAFARALQAREGALPPEHAAQVDAIVEAALAARRMIHGLLAFARLGQAPLAKSRVDLNEVVAKTRHAVAADGSAARVRWQIAPLPQVAGDPALLQLAITNLLSNAVKYSRLKPEPEVRVEAVTRPDGRTALQVRDNGVGFDMAQAQRLFQPFERLHAASAFEGTGMGLANVRRIMEKHGGEVAAEGVPGQGAVFTLVF